LSDDAAGRRADPDDLFTRTGLSDELLVLLKRHPRATWQGHQDLTDMGRFWLERHAMFRELAAALTDGATDFAEERTAPAAFLPWFAPRFNFFLNELHTHHHVEDHHYFPAFRAAEPRLARGFEVLDRDHATIDGLIHALADAGTALDAALRGPGDIPAARATLAATLGKTLPALTRHLDDEEDLVVPLMLDESKS